MSPLCLNATAVSCIKTLSLRYKVIMKCPDEVFRSNLLPSASDSMAFYITAEA